MLSLLALAVISLRQTPTPPGANAPAVSAPAHSPGHLDARIVVVDELDIKPVALTDFDLTGPTKDKTQKVRTDADGKIVMDLDPGSYTLTNSQPLTYKGKQYTWTKTFDITSGQPTTISLTQSDATVTDAAPTREISDAAKLYQRYVHSVALVESDAAQGSGFLVDPSGLLLTNFHVIKASTGFSVRFGPGESYDAQVLASDPESDVAVLRVNPNACKGKECLPLLAQKESLGVEGEKVIAIGNPLHQQEALTEGIISKVEPDVLISDVNINHGNSGGPLLNMAGVAIGITTFGDTAIGGPGISGIISIHKAEKALEQAKAAEATTQPPSDDKLPDVSSVGIPDDMVEQVASKIRRTDPYFKAPKNFRTYVETPFDVHANDLAFEKAWDKNIARRYKGKMPADQQQEHGPRAFWTKYVGVENAPLVTIKVLPWPQEKSASIWTRLLVSPYIRPDMELRDDFARMVLLRDGKEVVPVRRLRIRDTIVYDGYNVTIADTALAGVYAYDPRAFEPSANLELLVWKNDRQDPTSIKVDKKFQQSIWEQFSGWAQLAEGTTGLVLRDFNGSPQAQAVASVPTPGVTNQAPPKPAVDRSPAPVTPAVAPSAPAPAPTPAPAPAPAPSNPTPSPAPKPAPTPAPAPAPTPPAPLVGQLDGIEPDTSALEARIKTVSTQLGDLKPWDVIVSVRTSDKADFVDVDSWSTLHDVLLKNQARGEIAIKVRRGDNVIVSKAVAK